MAHSTRHHKIKGVLSSLDMLLFHLRVHNTRSSALLEELNQMPANSHGVVYNAIKEFADDLPPGAEPGTNVAVEDIQQYVAHLQLANRTLREEMRKFRNQADAVNKLCSVMLHMIGQHEEARDDV